jgi:hypothetical protein
MKLRSLGILLALAAAVFLAVACGGGDNTKSSATPTSSGNSAAGSTASDQAFKDYFQQLSTILTTVDAQSKQLNTQYPNAGQDPDQTGQFLTAFLPVENSAVNDVKNLNPPSSVKDLHDRFVAAIEDLVAADTTISNDVQSINTAADMKAYFDSHQTDFSAKSDLVNSICSELQTQANSKSLSVDLKCSGASSSTAPTPAGGAASPGGESATPGGGAATPAGGATTQAPGGAPPAATAAAP